MFNTYRETTGCYGDVNVESYPQNVDDSNKVSSNPAPAWNMHASGNAVHGPHHGNHPGHSSHSPAPAHYHSAFHHHTANAAVDSYGYSLAQATHKENDPIAGKDVIRSSSPSSAVATATWQNNRSRPRYPPNVPSGAFLPYPTQLNHYDGPPLETGPHGMGHSHMLGRKQSWPGENPFASMPSGGQFQRDPAAAMYGENVRGNVSGGIIRHTTNVSAMEPRNLSTQHQAVPQHLHHQQQSLIQQQQQQQPQPPPHSVPHHQLLCQLVQKEREAHRLPGYQDRHSVVRSRISGYPEPLFPPHQHPQYCSSQDVLRKGPLPVPIEADRRSAFTARQASAYPHGPSNWNKGGVPFVTSFHAQQMLAPQRGGGSAFQPCNKVGEHEMYPPESLIWPKSGQMDHGGQMQGPGHASWVHDAQSQMFLSRQMNKPGLINASANVLGLDTGQMAAHSAMQPAGARQPSSIPKAAPGPMPYQHQQQHIHLHNPHLRSQMMHPSQAPPQHALQQQPMMQHQSSPLSNSQHSPMVTSPHDMQSPQMSNPCSQQPSQQQTQQPPDNQLICNDDDEKETRGNTRSLRNCLDVRQFLANWDEDTEVGTPRPHVDDGDAGENIDQPLPTTEEEALVVLDCRSLRREEAANLLNMYSVPEAESLLACSDEGMFSTGTDTVAQSALQNLLDSVTSSGSNSTTIATPMTSPTGQTGGRSLDMLLNAALPTPPASQEQNIAQSNMPLNTPVAVVSLGSPLSPHLADTIRQPKMDETGFGVLSPTSPAASVKFTCATVNTPFVKFPPNDDPPSVIQSSRDHMGFSASHQFSCDKRDVHMKSPSPSKAADLPVPVPVPLTPGDSAQPPVADAYIIPSPAPSDASIESKMTTSLRAFRKQKTHSPDRISEAPDSFDSHSHDTSDAHPRISRTSSVLESDDAVDRSQWAFAQITKTSRTPPHDDVRVNNASSIIKSTQNWEMTNSAQDVQSFKLTPCSRSEHSGVDKSTTPLNCGLETQKSESSKFDKSTSPTIFLTNKDTQTEESRQNSKKMDSCAFNDTFAQTSVRCIQDEIQNDTFPQTSARLQDEIQHDPYAQTSFFSLHEEIENYNAQEALNHVPEERLPLNQTEVSRVENLRKQTETIPEFASGPTNQVNVTNTAEQLPSVHEPAAQDMHRAVAEATNSNKCSTGCGTTESERNPVFSKPSDNVADLEVEGCRTEEISTNIAKQFAPLPLDIVKVSPQENIEPSKYVENSERNELSSADKPISEKDSTSEEKNRSVGTGIDEEFLNNELCPQYLSRIVDSSPGNIPKILLSRLREKSSKKNGVIKRLPSIRLRRVCSPMSSSGSDPEYVCSVSATEPGTPSKVDGNTMDSVLSDQTSNDHKKVAPLHLKKQVKHCDVEVQSSPLSVNTDAERSYEDNISVIRNGPCENDNASAERNLCQVSIFDSKNYSSEAIEEICLLEERSIRVQTEEHEPSSGEMKTLDATASNTPHSDDLNEIIRNSEMSSGLSISTSQEVICTNHQETVFVTDLPTCSTDSSKPDAMTLNQISQTPDESQAYLPALVREEPSIVQIEVIRQNERELQSTSSRSSPEIASPSSDTKAPNESERILDLTTGPEKSLGSKSSDELEREENFAACEEKEKAIDLSVQKIANRSESGDWSVASPRCISPIDFCRGTSTGTAESHQAGENVTEKEEMEEKTTPSDGNGEEKMRQSVEPQNKTFPNLPDLSEEVSPEVPLVESVEAQEISRVSTESVVPSSVECNVTEENVFSSPRILSNCPSIDICENDIGHDTVNQKASSQQFFETDICHGEPSTSHAVENIIQENISATETNITKGQASPAGPIEEVESSPQNVSMPSPERTDRISITEETSCTPEYLSERQSKVSVSEEIPSSCVPEKTTFSEPVAYSDLFGAKSNGSKCDLSDVVVRNPFFVEEIPQLIPESCHEIQKDSEPIPLANETLDVNLSALSIEPRSPAEPPVNGENSPQTGCEENHTRDSTPCSSNAEVETETQIDCGEDNASTSSKVCGSPLNTLSSPESNLDVETGDIPEPKSHDEDSQITPAASPDEISPLIQPEDVPCESVSQNLETLSDPLSKDAPAVDHLEHPTEESATSQPSSSNVVVDLSFQQESASSGESASTVSVSDLADICLPPPREEDNLKFTCDVIVKEECMDVVEICESPSTEQECSKSINKQIGTEEIKIKQEIVYEENNYVICLSDIPLPSEEGYQNYLAKQNSITKPEPVFCETSEIVSSSENSKSRNFSVQVEEDLEVTTADKDTQSSDDSFTLSDEERAFPDPLAPNFDVTRIPLPDECIALKNRILKARNRKMCRELCGNECCTSSNKNSEVNSTATSVGIQCSKPSEARNFFSYRSKSSQTHKIQIKLKPRRPSLSPFHSHDNQTLMELVEDVSKVLDEGDGADSLEQVSAKVESSPTLFPEDRPQACKYVIEPSRSKYCDNPDVDEVLTIGAGPMDDCDFLSVRCKEVFPVNAALSLGARVEEMNATSPAVLPQALNSPTHSLESERTTDPIATSSSTDSVSKIPHEGSADNVTLSDHPVASCSEAPREIQASSSTTLVSPILNKTVVKVCEPNDQVCSEIDSPSSTAGDCGEIVRFEQKTDALDSPDLGGSRTPAKCVDFIVEDEQEKCQEFSVVDDKALLNSTEYDLSKSNICVTDQLLSTSFDSGSNNCKSSNESDVSIGTSNPVVSNADMEKTEIFENKFESNSDSKSLKLGLQKFIEEEKKFICDTYERENVPCAQEENIFTPVGVLDQFFCTESKKEESASWEETENSCHIDDKDNILLRTKEEAISTTATEKDNSSLLSFKNTPCNLEKQVPSPTTNFLSLNAEPEDIDASTTTSEPSISFGEVHMAIGKRMYTLSSEWQTVYLDGGEKDDMATSSEGGGSENRPEQTENVSVKPTESLQDSEDQLAVSCAVEAVEELLPNPVAADMTAADMTAADAAQTDVAQTDVAQTDVAPAPADMAGAEDQNEDELPPLDAPGLEAERSADSDSDREMPCLQPESPSQAVPGIPCCTQELAAAHLGAEAVQAVPEDAHSAHDAAASKASPVFSTSGLACTTAPRKDMKDVAPKRPHHSNDTDSDASGSDDSDTDSRSDGGRQKRTKRRRADTPEARQNPEDGPEREAAIQVELAAAEDVSEAELQVPLVAADVPEAVSETSVVSLGEVPEATVDEEDSEQASEAVAVAGLGVGVDCIEISDIRTDPAEWSRDSDMTPNLVAPEDCVEIISTEESVREEVVEAVLEDEDDVKESGEPRPRLKCSLSWNRVLLAGEAFVLGPAKVGVRLEEAAGYPDEALERTSPWNVADRPAESTGGYEENNNQLPKSPPLSPVFKVSKLILKRPASDSPDRSAPCSSGGGGNHSDSRSPDGSHFLKTKGALKSYHHDEAGVRRRREDREDREGNPRHDKGRHRHGRQRWSSHLSPAASTPARSPGAAAADAEVPKVIIKRQSSPTWRLQATRPHVDKALVVVLERDPLIDAMAVQEAARLRRLKRGKELRASEPRRRDSSSHRHSRGSSVRGSSEPRRRHHTPPPRKRSRSERGLRDAMEALAEDDQDDDDGKPKRRKKSAFDEDRRGRGRRREKDKDRKQAKMAATAHMHINELVKRWQMTPPGKDTPMPPSPDPASASPQYDWHGVEARCPEDAAAAVAAFPDAPEPEPEAVPEQHDHGHWSQLDVPSPVTAVAVDAPSALAGDAVEAAGYACGACGMPLSGECSEGGARAEHVKQHSYHCQRCYQAFASQGDFIQHLEAVHPNSQQLHHCLLCLRTFPNEREHAIHIKGPSHCHMERSQRRTIHTLFRMFTGSDCPRLSPLTPEDMHALDWLPNDSGVIHFYHQATPLQLATEGLNIHHGSAASQSENKNSPRLE